MPLVDVIDMMERARHGGYAVGYFESWNLESLQGVLDAVEQAKSPVIVGFNGEFMSHESRLCEERLAIYGAMGRAACEAASVPCGFIFNECSKDDWVTRAAAAGFNLVMPADAGASLANYTLRVAAIVPGAHERGVAVEAEIDALPDGSSGSIEPSVGMTDPAVAAEFVDSTDVDLLAVSVGNVHIMVRGEQSLDLPHLAKITERVHIPLVLHGGSGIAAKSMKEAIALGVTKVNYGTYLKQRYLAAVRRAVTLDELNPHELLGIGGESDVMVAGRLAVRDAVLERLGVLGSCNKA